MQDETKLAELVNPIELVATDGVNSDGDFLSKVNGAPASKPAGGAGFQAGFAKKLSRNFKYVRRTKKRRNQI